jgi:hypothetical protein
VAFDREYLEELKKRKESSRVYREYQLIGLEIATALRDEKHKSLYIKLAKQKNAHKLLDLAKDVASRSSIRNKGAYFMSLLKKEVRLKF